MSSAASTSTSVASGSARASAVHTSEGATPDLCWPLSGWWGKWDHSSVQLYILVINTSDEDKLGIV